MILLLGNGVGVPAGAGRDEELPLEACLRALVCELDGAGWRHAHPVRRATMPTATCKVREVS